MQQRGHAVARGSIVVRRENPKRAACHGMRFALSSARHKGHSLRRGFVGIATDRLDGSAATEHLARLWETPRNAVAWLSTVDHKKLGKRYIITAFLVFALGAVEAAL